MYFIKIVYVKSVVIIRDKRSSLALTEKKMGKLIKKKEENKSKTKPISSQLTTSFI